MLSYYKSYVILSSSDDRSKLNWNNVLAIGTNAIRLMYKMRPDFYTNMSQDPNVLDLLEANDDGHYYEGSLDCERLYMYLKNQWVRKWHGYFSIIKAIRLNVLGKK